MRSASVFITGLIAVVCFSTACFHTPEYKKEFKHVTKKGRVFNYNTWDANIIWNATFFSDEFRQEFAKEHAKLNNMEPLESARWMATQGMAQQDNWEFLISIYTKEEYDHFSMNPDSFWKIILTTEDGEIIHPVAIEKMHNDPYAQVMFDYVDRWTDIYKILFPKVNLGKSFSLTLHSVVGQSTLKWKLSK